jgi:hypothetical protein
MRNLQDEAVSCRHCDKTLAYGTSRQQQHLDQCEKYQTSLQEVRKRKRQSSITLIAAFDQISPYEHSKLDELAALIIYDAGLPLGFLSIRLYNHSFIACALPTIHQAESECLLPC